MSPNRPRFVGISRDVAANLIITVPYRWLGNSPGHINDPVDEDKLEGWMEIKPNAWQLVQEPFREQRLIALYNLAGGPAFRYKKEFVLDSIARRTEGA